MSLYLLLWLGHFFPFCFFFFLLYTFIRLLDSCRRLVSPSFLFLPAVWRARTVETRPKSVDNTLIAQTSQSAATNSRPFSSSDDTTSRFGTGPRRRGSHIESRLELIVWIPRCGFRSVFSAVRREIHANTRESFERRNFRLIITRTVIHVRVANVYCSPFGTDNADRRMCFVGVCTAHLIVRAAQVRQTESARPERARGKRITWSDGAYTITRRARKIHRRHDNQRHVDVHKTGARQ